MEACSRSRGRRETQIRRRGMETKVKNERAICLRRTSRRGEAHHEYSQQQIWTELRAELHQRLSVSDTDKIVFRRDR